MAPVYIPPAFIGAALLSVSLLLFYAIRYIRSTLRPANYPPGPPITPGLGNLHQIPLATPYVTFASWAKTYGPMLGLKFGSSNVVILNKATLIHDLFVRRGVYYNGRPKMHIACEYVFPGEWDRQVAFMGREFQQRHRKATRYRLGRAGLDEVAPGQRSM